MQQNNKSDEDKFLDDYDQLLQEQELEDEEEELKEEKAERIAQVDDLDSLDDLLKESVTIASARKLKSQGRRLNTSEEEALERLRILEEIASWEPKVAIVHLIATTCHCGATSQRLSRFYEIHQHRKNSSQKLFQVTETNLPVYNYETQEHTPRCLECSFSAITPHISAKDYPLLSSLGDPRNLHVESNTLLNELLEKVEVLEVEIKAEPEPVEPPSKELDEAYGNLFSTSGDIHNHE